MSFLNAIRGERPLKITARTRAHVQSPKFAREMFAAIERIYQRAGVEDCTEEERTKWVVSQLASRIAMALGGSTPRRCTQEQLQEFAKANWDEIQVTIVLAYENVQAAQAAA